MKKYPLAWFVNHDYICVKISQSRTTTRTEKSKVRTFDIVFEVIIGTFYVNYSPADQVVLISDYTVIKRKSPACKHQATSRVRHPSTKPFSEVLAEAGSSPTAMSGKERCAPKRPGPGAPGRDSSPECSPPPAPRPGDSRRASGGLRGEEVQEAALRGGALGTVARRGAGGGAPPLLTAAWAGALSSREGLA